MQRLLHTLYALCFPMRCIGCGAYRTALCDRCVAILPLAREIGEPNMFAVYDYADPTVKRAIGMLKYHRHGELAAALARAAAPHIIKYLSDIVHNDWPKPIVFIPIPQHRQKLQHRGYNQSELIAYSISKIVKTSRVRSLLYKTHATISQAKTVHQSERRTNLIDSMTARRPIDPETIYILVDDVTTTGATFTEAKRALHAAGARSIICIALAHGFVKKIRKK